MKKKILSVLVSVSLIMGIIGVNASNIVYEESIDEETAVNEMDITPLMATNDAVAYADSNGTLEFVKTIQGYGYTAFIRYDNSSMYWSNNTSYDARYEPYINVPEINNANCPYSSYGSRTAEKVPIYKNVYLSKGSILYFHLNGSSCSHSGSTATLYLSDAYSSPVAYNSNNQKYNIGTMVVTSGQNASGTDFYYTIHKSGYYTVDAMGQATACSVSYGHGIYMNQTYYIYRYKYDISYNLNGGNLSKINPTYYYEENDDIVLNNPTKTGYTFIGWTSPDLTSPTTSAIITSGSAGDKSYIANWQINQYPVIYIDADENGNEIGRTTKLVDYDALVKGSDIGDEKTDNAYYNQYRYVFDTSAKVTTDGAIVYRVFEFCETEAVSNLQWNDNNNADGFRPDKYKLKLKQNGKIIDEVELPSDTTNYTFLDLPKYDLDGNAYNYSFDVDAGSRYQINFGEDGNLIVEDYLPANFTVVIPKTIILDGNTGKADYQIAVNGTFYYNDTLTVEPESNFTLTDRSKISTMQANVNQNKTGFTKEDDMSRGCNTKGSIQTDRVLFPGSWSGTFNFDIKFKMQN